MNKLPTGYTVIDVEATGPDTVRNSIISLGVVVITIDKEILFAKRVNIAEAPGSVRNPETMKFWAQHPDAWATITKDPVPFIAAMRAVTEPLHRVAKDFELRGAAFPSSYDAVWWRMGIDGFGLTDPLTNGHSWLCIRTACDYLGMTSKPQVMAQFGEGLHVTHDPLEDCFAEAVVAANVERKRLKLPDSKGMTLLANLPQVIKNGGYMAPRFAF